MPVALLAWVGSPLPAGIPSVSDVTDALRDTYIPDEFLVKALALVCWVVWFELTASLLVEAVAYVRGRKAGAVPLAGGLQRGAARLVAGVALLGAVVASKGLPTSGSSAPARRRPPSRSWRSWSTTARPPADAAAAACPAPVAAPVVLPVYEVQRRDTLWDIAETHLGDPFRWPEIFQINQGCPQSDGGCLTDPDLIHPGWQLQLPADAVGLAPAAPARGRGARPCTGRHPRRRRTTRSPSRVAWCSSTTVARRAATWCWRPRRRRRTTTFDGMVLLPDDGPAGPGGPTSRSSPAPPADDEVAGGAAAARGLTPRRPSARTRQETPPHGHDPSQAHPDARRSRRPRRSCPGAAGSAGGRWRSWRCW